MDGWDVSWPLTEQCLWASSGSQLKLHCYFTRVLPHMQHDITGIFFQSGWSISAADLPHSTYLCCHRCSLACFSSLQHPQHSPVGTNGEDAPITPWHVRKCVHELMESEPKYQIQTIFGNNDKIRNMGVIWKKCQDHFTWKTWNSLLGLLRQLSHWLMVVSSSLMVLLIMILLIVVVGFPTRRTMNWCTLQDCKLKNTQCSSKGTWLPVYCVF